MKRGGIIWLALLALAFGAAQAAPPPKATVKKAPPSKSAPKHPGNNIAESGPLHQGDLAGIASLGLDQLTSTDPFKTKPAAKYVGREFSFSQPVLPADNDRSDSEATWSYDRTLGVIHFRIERYTPIHVFFNNKLTGSYVGSNAFGVKKVIKRYSALEVVINEMRKSKDADFDLPVTPEEGSALTKAVGVIYDGTIVSDGDESPVSCKSSTDGATIDDPIEQQTMTCELAGRITRIAFVDVRGNDIKVLHEWLASSPK